MGTWQTVAAVLAILNIICGGATASVHATFARMLVTTILSVKISWPTVLPTWQTVAAVLAILNIMIGAPTALRHVATVTRTATTVSARIRLATVLPTLTIICGGATASVHATFARMLVTTTIVAKISSPTVLPTWQTVAAVLAILNIIIGAPTALQHVATVTTVATMAPRACK